LPDLIPLIGIQVPIYDLKESLVAQTNSYMDVIGYVADNNAKVRTVTIWMIVLTAFFFILGVIAAIVLKVRQSKTERSDSEV